MFSFSQFICKPAQAVTGVPVPTQGVGAAQGVAHVQVMDVRIPGFARAQGTHLFYERKAIKVSLVFYLTRRYSLQDWNHYACFIFLFLLL